MLLVELGLLRCTEHDNFALCDISLTGDDCFGTLLRSSKIRRGLVSKARIMVDTSGNRRSDFIEQKEGATILHDDKRQKGGKGIMKSLKSVFSLTKKNGDTRSSKSNVSSKHSRLTFGSSRNLSSTKLDSSKNTNTLKEEEGTASSRSKGDFPVEWISIPSPESQQSPYDFFRQALHERSYSTEEFDAGATGIMNISDIRVESDFVQFISEAIRHNDEARLTELLEGMTLENPIYNSGESVVHLVCRRGQTTCLELLMEKGASLQVCEGYGRNPMHSACAWSRTSSPNFEIMDILLEHDKSMLLMKDERGCTPLYYIPGDQHILWIAYLKKKMDYFWPDLTSSEDVLEEIKSEKGQAEAESDEPTSEQQLPLTSEDDAIEANKPIGSGSPAHGAIPTEA